MRRKLRFWIAVVAVIGLTISTAAETYTIEKCIETALENNYGVIAAKNYLNAARWEVYSAYGELLPSVSISSYKSEDWNPAYFFWEGARTPHPNPGTSTTYGGALSFGQSYPGLGLYTYANIKYKKAQKNSYFYDYLNTQKELVLTIKEAYFNVIKTKMLVDVSRDAVRRGEEQFKVAQSRYDLGSASLSDVLKAKVLRSNAKLDLITAENGYNLSQANLNYIMGIEVNKEVEVTEDFPEKTLDITYDQALNEALSFNPSYHKASYDLIKAKSSLMMSKASFLPSILFNVRHRTTVGKSDNLFDFQEEYAGRTFYVELGYSIFNNLRDVSNLVAGKKSVSSQKENLKNTRNYVALEIQQNFLDIQQNQEKLNLNEELVAAAQEDLNIVKEKYNLGAATIIEVLDAEVSFKQAQVNQVEAQFDYNLAVSRLEKVMGR